MADDQTPSDRPGFDDLFSEIGEESSFTWDGEEIEPESEEETRPVVCFRVGGDHFAIDAGAVREILGDLDFTALPGAPPHVSCITVVRRQVIGLLSLRHFLNLDDRSSDDLSNDENEGDGSARSISSERVLLVDTAHYTVGLRIDEVSGIENWPHSALNAENLPENIRPSTQRYARGSRHQGDSLCVYLDLEPLLDDAAAR